MSYIRTQYHPLSNSLSFLSSFHPAASTLLQVKILCYSNRIPTLSKLKKKKKKEHDHLPQTNPSGQADGVK
jgi:hypothetical protein